MDHHEEALVAEDEDYDYDPFTAAPDKDSADSDEHCSLTPHPKYPNLGWNNWSVGLDPMFMMVLSPKADLDALSARGTQTVCKLRGPNTLQSDEGSKLTTYMQYRIPCHWWNAVVW